MIHASQQSCSRSIRSFQHYDNHNIWGFLTLGSQYIRSSQLPFPKYTILALMVITLGIQCNCFFLSKYHYNTSDLHNMYAAIYPLFKRIWLQHILSSQENRYICSCFFSQMIQPCSFFTFQEKRRFVNQT